MLAAIGPEGTRALANLAGKNEGDIEVTILLMPYDWKKVLLDNAILRGSSFVITTTPAFHQLLVLAKEVLDTAANNLVQDAAIVDAIRDLSHGS